MADLTIKDVKKIVMILGEHFHIATGHKSKNKNKLYKCANKGRDDPFGCCLSPIYDKEGNEIQG